MPGHTHTTHPRTHAQNTSRPRRHTGSTSRKAPCLACASCTVASAHAHTHGGMARAGFWGCGVVAWCALDARILSAQWLSTVLLPVLQCIVGYRVSHHVPRHITYSGAPSSDRFLIHKQHHLCLCACARAGLCHAVPVHAVAARRCRRPGPVHGGGDGRL